MNMPITVTSDEAPFLLHPRTAGSCGTQQVAPPPPPWLAQHHTKCPPEEWLALEVWTALAGMGLQLWQQVGSEVLLLQHRALCGCWVPSKRTLNRRDRERSSARFTFCFGTVTLNDFYHC